MTDFLASRGIDFATTEDCALALTKFASDPSINGESELQITKDYLDAPQVGPLASSREASIRAAMRI
jgi:hypothetical protein